MEGHGPVSQGLNQQPQTALNNVKNFGHHVLHLPEQSVPPSPVSRDPAFKTLFLVWILSSCALPCVCLDYLSFSYTISSLAFVLQELFMFYQFNETYFSSLLVHFSIPLYHHITSCVSFLPFLPIIMSYLKTRQYVCIFVPPEYRKMAGIYWLISKQLNKWLTFLSCKYSSYRCVISLFLWCYFFQFLLSHIKFLKLY